MSTLSALPARSAGRAAKFLVPLAVAVICLALVQARLDTISPSVVWDQVRGVPVSAWGGAALATVLSFWAIGRYDGVAHRHLRTGIDARTARRAGVAAIAFSQTVGFGLVSGGFARWRLIPHLSPLRAVQVTLVVAVTFLGALALFGALACALAPPLPAMRLPGMILACVLTALLTGIVAFPMLRAGPLRLRSPGLPAIGAILLWTLIDTGAAALALYLLLPDPVDLGMGQVFVIYLLALGAALLSGTPGGVGPFEIVVLALAPTQDPAALVAGIVAFRLIYFALPAAVAGLWLLWPPQTRLRARSLQPDRHLPRSRTRAETGVLAQSDGVVLHDGSSAVAVLDLHHSVVGLFDPICGPVPTALQQVQHRARGTNRVACLYKCNARNAALARRAGWQVMHVADEARIDPARFTTSGRAMRQLRRKLRHAETAGLRIAPVSPIWPLVRMAAIDAEWQARNGRARGTTMGRYDPEHLRQQHVWLAWQGDTLCGFVSFHFCDREWCLDVMRIISDAPDGTMQALICTAIRAARAAHIPQISLAAVPTRRATGTPGRGLAQFKAAFAPRWAPLYLAAPSRWALVLCAADLARAVHFPAPLRPPDCTAPHEENEKFGFAIPRPA